MDAPEREDIFARLESTIASWSDEVSDAHEGLTHQIAQAREDLEALVRVLAERRSSPPVLAAAKTKLETLARILREQVAWAGEAQSRIDSIEEALAEARRHVSAGRAREVRARSGERLLAAELALAERRGAAWAAEATNAAAEACSLGERLATLEQQAASRIEELEAARSELARQAEASEGASEQTAQLQRAAAQVRAELQSLLAQEAQLATVENLADVVEGACVVRQGGFARTDAEGVDWPGRLAERDAALAVAAQRVERLDGQLMAQDEEIASLRAHEAELVAAHEGLASQLEELGDERAALLGLSEEGQEQVALLRRQLEHEQALDQVLAEERDRSAELAADVEALRAALAERDEALRVQAEGQPDSEDARLEEALAALEAREREWASSKEDLAAQLHALRAEKVGALLELEEARMEAALARRAVEESESATRVEQLEAELGERTMALEALQRAAALPSPQTEETPGAEPVLDEARGDAQALREALAEREDELSRRTRDLDDVRDEAASLRELAGEARELSKLLEAERARANDLAFQLASLEQAGSGAVSTPDRPERDVMPLDAYDADGRRLLMGEVLERAGAITGEQLEACLQLQGEGRHRRLGELLVEMGYASEETIARTLAGQLRLPYLELSPADVDPAAARVVSAQLAQKHQSIPVGMHGPQLTVAMANPLDLVALEDLQLASAHEIEPVVATASAIRAAIEAVYA